MSENKRYYWLKLNENFFEEDTIAWLEEQENGKDYVIFYLKLCLKSLKDDGKLIRYVGARLMPYDVKALSKLTNTPVDTVAVAMKTFDEIGLVEKLETGEIFLTQINEMIGSETEVAKRVRKHRAKQVVVENQDLLQSNIEVTKSNTEIEIERDKEKEKEKEYIVEQDFIFPDYLSEKSIESIKKGNPKNYERRIPIAYLNQVTKKNYKYIDKSINLIKARLNEGFVIDDFKQVIDVKFQEWDKTEMEKYLRPETLFGTKFEGYLNQPTTNPSRLEYSRDDEEIGW